MGNPVPLDTFLEKMKVIYNSHPAYHQPGDGSGGVCDCIGLIIGSIRRSGGSWTGIHGSNYAARWEIDDPIEIKSVSDLFVGMAVFKYNTDPKDLPAKYKDPKNKYYNGDLRDFYHVGTVISVNPLKIMHMTSPSARIDKDLGKWRYGGKLKKVKYDGGGTILVEKFKAKVVVSSGSTVNMRKTSNPDSALVTRIPNGTIIPIFDDSTEMYQTQYENKVGYVNSKFLQKIGGGGGEVGIYIPLPKDVAEVVLNAMKTAKIQE